MTIKTNFESSLKELALNRDLKQVFHDFILVTLNVFTLNPSTNHLLEAYSRYSEMEIKETFPKILNHLLSEIHERYNDELGNDVLGEFCQKFYFNDEDNKQILTWKECKKTAKKTIPVHQFKFTNLPIDLLDVGCRSGRIMMVSHHDYGNRLAFFGVEYDWLFVAISTLNLYFNNVKHAEVIWINQSKDNAFMESYLLNGFPRLILRGFKKERSRAYELYQIYLKTKGLIKTSM